MIEPPAAAATAAGADADDDAPVPSPPPSPPSPPPPPPCRRPPPPPPPASDNGDADDEDDEIDSVAPSAPPSPDVTSPYAGGSSSSEVLARRLVYPVQVGFATQHVDGAPAAVAGRLFSWGVVVSRRYSQFVWLHRRLGETVAPQILPRFPGKLQLVPRIDEDLDCADVSALIRRQGALETYLRALLQRPQLRRSLPLKLFLSPDFHPPSATLIDVAAKVAAKLDGSGSGGGGGGGGGASEGLWHERPPPSLSSPPEEMVRCPSAAPLPCGATVCGRAARWRAATRGAPAPRRRRRAPRANQERGCGDGKR